MKKIINKGYCMSSFLAFRYIAHPEIIFGEGIEHVEFEPVEDSEKIACESAIDIGNNIEKQLKKVNPDNAALLLSGGIDSGILASYMPENSVAYTVLSPAKAAKIGICKDKI